MLDRGNYNRRGRGLWECWCEWLTGCVSRERDHHLLMRRPWSGVLEHKGSEVEGRSGVLIQALYLTRSGALGSHGNPVAVKCLICKVGCLFRPDHF